MFWRCLVFISMGDGRLALPQSGGAGGGSAVPGLLGLAEPRHLLPLLPAVPLSFQQLLGFGRLAWFGFRLSCFETCGTALGDFRSLDRRCAAPEGNDERGATPSRRGSSRRAALAAPGRSTAASPRPALTPPHTFPSAGRTPGRAARLPRAAPRACAAPAVTERGGAGRAPAAPQEGAGVCARAPWGGRGRRACAFGPAASALGSAGKAVRGSVGPSGSLRPAGSGPHPARRGHACRPLSPRHGQRREEPPG